MADIELKIEEVYVVLHGGKEVWRGLSLEVANEVMDDLEELDTEIDQ